MSGRLRVYDRLDPLEAAGKAWVEKGSHPLYHEEMKRKVRFQMPLLARALDRHQHGDRSITGEAPAQYSPVVKQILELHTPGYSTEFNATYGIDPRCSECNKLYPCPTAVVANG